MTLPLKQATIILTRAQEQASALHQALEDKGARVLDLPLIKISQDYDLETLQDVFQDIALYEWVIFTSQNGVKHFFDLFFKRFKDIRCLGPMRIACVGEATAKAIQNLHLEVDFCPTEATAKELGMQLVKEQSLENVKVLLITGNLNSPDLFRTLEQEGKAIVDTLQVYKTEHQTVIHHPSSEAFRKGGADAILFTSPSTVHAFYAQAKDLQISPGGKTPLAGSMGPSTTEALKHYGITPSFEASPRTLEGFVDSLIHKLSLDS